MMLSMIPYKIDFARVLTHNTKSLLEKENCCISKLAKKVVCFDNLQGGFLFIAVLNKPYFCTKLHNYLGGLTLKISKINLIV